MRGVWALLYKMMMLVFMKIAGEWDMTQTRLDGLILFNANLRFISASYNKLAK